MPDTPEYILFAQHGWADTHHAMRQLAYTLASPRALVVAPDLGYLRTWLRIEPLIRQVEQTAAEVLARYPQTPLRIVGHSMGSLIWLEVLRRQPQWWPRIQNIVHLAAPAGGADLGRMIDPLEWGIGIARDLGINRRRLAEAVAAVIPTLVIAGNSSGRDDSTVTVDSTRLRTAHFVCLPGLKHPLLRNHPAVAAIIRHFWHSPPAVVGDVGTASSRLIAALREVTGMHHGSRHDFHRTHVLWLFCDYSNLSLRHDHNGSEHVFVADSKGHLHYSGFVEQPAVPHLQRILKCLKQQHQADLIWTADQL